MRLLAPSARAALLGCAVGLGVVLAAAPALAIGEEITDVRVMGNQRTEESTVRTAAGVSIGDTLEMDTLDTVRARLNTTGLFSDVNVWWEQYKTGVRVNISVKDKFPWAPVPTGSFSANNKSFGTWIYWQLQGNIQRQNIPEYFPTDDGATLGPYRSTLLSSYGVEPMIGIAWFRRVKTQVAWRLEKFSVDKSYLPDDPNQMALPPAMQSTLGAKVGVAKASISFDFRSREFAVMTGTALGGGVDISNPDFRSELTFWRVGGGVEHGIKFFKSHNLVTSIGATFGKDLPFWMENAAGGPNDRGYLFQQFRGDSQLGGHAEYHFPLFSISALDFRALGFYDINAIWFRDLPPGIGMYATRNTPDQRTFLIDVANGGYPPGGGFDFRRDIHQSVGGGLRFFLRSVAVPLIGLDAGYGLESRGWRITLVIGA